MSAPEQLPPSEWTPIPQPDCVELLRIARITLKQWLIRGDTPVGAPHRASLIAPTRAFVTVYVRGELRGCVGRLEADLPLYKAIIDLAVSAATRDRRFAPVRLDELPDVRLEISVLSPPRPFPAPRDPAALSIGRDGLVVTRGLHRGLLLPKVAAEHDLDAAAFLAETCKKAELPADAWRDPETEVEVFRAQVFAEPP